MSQKKKVLTAEQHQVCFLKGTEPPFSGKYLNNKEVGIYTCVCCDAKLFRSQDKYDSGSGWPSYFQPVDENAVKRIEDNSHGMGRIEVICGSCGAHLGHVFTDGPAPTGLRYCINSLSLSFIKNNNENI